MNTNQNKGELPLKNGRRPNPDIDLALAVLSSAEVREYMALYGVECLTAQQIADIAGCSVKYIQKVERKALRKLARRFHYLKRELFQ